MTEKKPKTMSERDKKMFAAGWAPVSMVAEKLGVHHATVYRMIRDAELEVRELMNKKYVSISSIIVHLGEDNARILGLIAPPKVRSAAPADPAGA